jgi:hypothetical protein
VSDDTSEKLWYELPMYVTNVVARYQRNHLDTGISNGQNSGATYPPRHYWPRSDDTERRQCLADLWDIVETHEMNKLQDIIDGKTT